MKLATAFLLTFLASSALGLKDTKHRLDADERTPSTSTGIRTLKGSKCLSPTRQEDRVAKIYETYSHDYLICEGGGVSNEYNPATSAVESGGFFDAQLDNPSTGQPVVIPFQPVKGAPSNIAAFEFGPFGADGNFLTGVWNFVDDSIALVQGNTNAGLTQITCKKHSEPGYSKSSLHCVNTFHLSDLAADPPTFVTRSRFFILDTTCPCLSEQIHFDQQFSLSS